MMGTVLIKYAYDEDENLVGVDEAVKGKMYYCVVCGEPLCVKDGPVKTKHFAHTVNKNCNYETYLHYISKIKIKKAFEDSSSFKLSYGIKQSCNVSSSCSMRIDKCCRNSTKEIELKDEYNLCELEKEVTGVDGNKYKADILLSSSTGERSPLLLEICVSHECTESKKTSGLQIVELKISSESDLDSIVRQCFIRESDTVDFYNFESTEQVEMDRKIARFIRMKEGGTRVVDLTCKTCDKAVDEGSDLELNVPVDRDDVRRSDIDYYINKKYGLEKLGRCRSCNNYRSNAFCKCSYSMPNVDDDGAYCDMYEGKPFYVDDYWGEK